MTDIIEGPTEGLSGDLCGRHGTDRHCSGADMGLTEATEVVVDGLQKTG